MTAKVYVTQETSHDVSGAEAWGEVVFITKDDLNNARASIGNVELMRRIRFMLNRFDPEYDWIVIDGSPYVSAAVFLTLGAWGHRYVRILRWDNRDRVYRPLHVELGRAFA